MEGKAEQMQDVEGGTRGGRGNGQDSRPDRDTNGCSQVAPALQFQEPMNRCHRPSPRLSSQVKSARQGPPASFVSISMVCLINVALQILSDIKTVSQSEFWVSHKKYWCTYCEIFIADDAPSRTQHENGLRHQGNKERFIRNLYKTGQQRKQDQDEEKREVARIEQASTRPQGSVPRS